MKKFGKPRKFPESNTILVSNIPAPKNAISKIYSYFKKYGKIKSLWVEGTEATITYESAVSARKALSDPKSLMNNRFIKIQYVLNQNKSKTNLRQYIDNERVDKFSSEVNENIQNLIKETERLQKELFEQNRIKSEQAKLIPEIINEEKEKEDAALSQKKEKDDEKLRKIHDLEEQKTKLIIEAAKAASQLHDEDKVQSFKDQIDEIQTMIDLYKYDDLSSNDNADNANENNEDIDNNDNNIGPNNENDPTEEVEIVYEEVEDTIIIDKANNNQKPDEE